MDMGKGGVQASPKLEQQMRAMMKLAEAVRERAGGLLDRMRVGPPGVCPGGQPTQAPNTRCVQADAIIADLEAADSTLAELQSLL